VGEIMENTQSRTLASSSVSKPGIFKMNTAIKVAIIKPHFMWNYLYKTFKFDFVGLATLMAVFILKISGLDTETSNL
jgi:hypothetical protein